MPLCVLFNDTSTNDRTTWLWDFGDGNTPTEQNATHTYATNGTYTVRPTATNAGGTSSWQKVDYIVVLPQPPVVDFSAGVTAGDATMTVAVTLRSPRNTGTITGVWVSDQSTGTVNGAAASASPSADLSGLNAGSHAFSVSIWIPPRTRSMLQIGGWRDRAGPSAAHSWHLSMSRRAASATPTSSPARQKLL
jgi:hypothetical protein